jgi:hypothetical protein
MSFFGSSNKLSELIQDTITTLNKTSSLQPNTYVNALAMYISVEEAINDLTILDDSLDDNQKRQFWMQIQTQISMNPSMGMHNQGYNMNQNMGMGMHNQGYNMNQNMGMMNNQNMGMMNNQNMGMMNNQNMGMGMMNNQNMGAQSGFMSGLFGSTQGQGQGQGQGLFSSGGGMFSGVLQQLQQLKTQMDQNNTGEENAMTDSIKVASIQPILIQLLIQLNTLAMQLFPMAHPGKQVENILLLKAGCELGSGLGTRSPYSQQHGQYGQRMGGPQQYGRTQGFGLQPAANYNVGQDFGYNQSGIPISYGMGGKRRRTRRRKQRGGYHDNMPTYGSNAASVRGGRRRRRRTSRRSYRR